MRDVGDVDADLVHALGPRHHRQGVVVVPRVLGIDGDAEQMIGYAFKHAIEGMLTKTTVVIIGSLVGLAALLWFAEKVSSRARSLEHITWKDASKGWEEARS